MSAMAGDLPPDGKTTLVDAILRFSDAATKEAAFNHYWTKLDEDSSERIDLDALGICIRLLPSVAVEERVSRS